jgi:hypothetical protein
MYAAGTFPRTLRGRPIFYHARSAMKEIALARSVEISPAAGPVTSSVFVGDCRWKGYGKRTYAVPEDAF